MTKQHFIALADAIREHNDMALANGGFQSFDSSQLETLIDVFQGANPRFNRQRWLDYIAGKCGPNGGARK